MNGSPPTLLFSFFKVNNSLRIPVPVFLTQGLVHSDRDSYTDKCSLPTSVMSVSFPDDFPDSVWTA